MKLIRIDLQTATFPPPSYLRPTDKSPSWHGNVPKCLGRFDPIESRQQYQKVMLGQNRRPECQRSNYFAQSAAMTVSLMASHLTQQGSFPEKEIRHTAYHIPTFQMCVCVNHSFSKWNLVQQLLSGPTGGSKPSSMKAKG